MPGTIGNVLNSELGVEQEYLNGLYARVDVLRDEAVAALTRADDTAPVWRAEVARLDAVVDGLCFGRLDLRDGRRVYIGRIGLFREEDDEPLLVDWRAPAARPFYTATSAAPDGVLRRRRITTRGRTVTALDDELVGAGELTERPPGIVLVGEAALMAAVTAQRSGRMRDIVTTLQAEQDRIVRDDHRGVLVVQGGPGTGKTAVALHRVAFLLYTHEHLRTRGVLVIGPSQVFLDYIGQVLPGLGENRVVTATIQDLRPDVTASRVDPPEVAARKGAAIMAERLADAVRARVRTPDLPIDVEFEQQVLRLDPDRCRRAVRKARRAGLPHNQAKLVFEREIVHALAQELVDRMEAVVFTDTGEALDGGSADGRLSEADLRALGAAGVVLGPDEDDGPRVMVDDADRAALRNALLADTGVQAALDDLWPALTPEQVVADLLGEGRDWSVADIPLLDEAAALVGESMSTCGHVVVDEAQELSEMDWRMLMRRCPTRSMTIVGDLAQTGSPGGAGTWERALRPHMADRWRLAPLTVNYRTPAEIMAATTDLLAAHHPGMRPPESVRASGETPWRLRADLTTPTDLAAAHADGQLAIIAPAAYLTALAAALSLPVEPDLTDKLVLLTPAKAKGLEFDAVLIVDPARILTEPLGHNDLYVAMTRATQRLGIVHPGPPPVELARMRERRV